MDSGPLSLDQAPPIAAPFRFFLTAPVFLLLAALLVLWQGPGIFVTRYAPATLALTHLITLGVMSMVMCGAVLQVLPVVVGSPVPRATLVAAVVHLLLTLGAPTLAAGFLTGSVPALVVGSLAAGSAFAVFLCGVGVSLSRAKSTSASVRPLWLAALGLAVTVGLGLTLGLGRAGQLAISSPVLADLHPAWGLLGWAALLIAGVAYQVVPMFLLTPQYPRWMTAWFAPTQFALLVARSGVAFLPDPARAWARPVLDVALGLGLATFAVVTLSLQARRKRKLPDVTLLFWRVAMGCLVLGVALWLAIPLAPEAHAESLRLAAVAVLAVGGAVSVITGMLYKIVPFLAWFHLQSRYAGKARIPNMKAVISDAAARRQAWGWCAGLALLGGTLAGASFLAWPAALAFAGAAIGLGFNLWRAVGVYRATLRQASASAKGP